MEKSYRIHTNISNDTLLNVNMKQDFDFLEILSLKLRQKDAYRLHSSNYGVIVGRVLANDAFGVPNAKVSMFIERDSSDSSELRNIYPYSDVLSKDSSARRYNILPDYSDDSCYRVVGTFPRKRYLLDDDVQLEVYDKYWKYTTVTNQAGDYMLFGVPEGGQQLHIDIDLSDIGILSQRPRDFIFKGHNIDEFDSPNQFKESTNLDGLQQIISQNKTTVVYPFWGDPENGIAAITRCDIQVNYKFEPTCVFMGSIVSDNDGNSIGHRCSPDEDSGLNSQLIAGEGTIEMIRKTQDGLVEEFPIKGNALIDSDGVWCYQIPMNLDYVGTDEYGNIAPTDNPSKGIPTRTQVRFRFSKRETGDEGFSRHTAKYLVPMNPIMREDSVIPKTQAETGLEMERMYNFGSNTPQSCFRDLYWNNVYSVKNFIPKVQVAHRAWSPDYGALKGSNLAENQNPIPFNKLRIDMPFSYMIVCILFTIVMIIVHIINVIIWALQELKNICLPKIPVVGRICPFFFIPTMACISLNAGLGDGSNTAFYPGCKCPGSHACQNADCPEGMEDGCIKSSDNHTLKDRIQQALALDYKIVKLDFYQDWLNGCLYMPLWYWRKRKKKKFLFFTISGAKNEFCDCDKDYSRLKTYVTCDIDYTSNSLDTDNDNTDEDEDRWHKHKRGMIGYSNGLIKGVENKDGLTAYYYVGYQPSNNDPIDLPIDKRTKPFQLVRLYATDIILIGNLNESNLYGIPQFFKALPSTTANLPPIATVEETLNDNLKEGNETLTDDMNESGTTITTGMDWGYYGSDYTPRFKSGLFIDLTCTYAGTKAKSCINVERLSELGVTLDTTYSMSYAHSSNGIKTGMIDSDGFINKLELDDLDNRATFATLNHIGFIPQDYQDSINGYTTQVYDENTGYLIPKFKYIYPVDFDGRLQPIMERYKSGFEQAMYDEQDESYITFRLGAENSEKKNENLEGRIRHFYNHRSGGSYEMPLYNNSFYFYFGINKGNTAIDKFNKLFFSPCFQRSKAPFSFDIESMGKSYCPEMYKDKVDKTKHKETAYNGNAYIRFTSDDIVTPFSYVLYDSLSNVVESGDNQTISDFVIGGSIELVDGKKVVKVPENNLTNQTYVLQVTDGNGRRITQRIELKIPRISLDFETESLMAKFYSTGSTRMDYICNDKDKYYGKIRIKSFSIDGARYYITAATVMSYDSEIDAYKIQLTGVNADDFNEETMYKVSGNTATALLKVSAINSPNVGWVRDCMCDTGNTVYSVNGQGSNIAAAEHNKWWFGNVAPENEDEKLIIGKTGDEEVAVNTIPTMFVYQPNRFNLIITQLCEKDGSLKEIEENTSSEIATVANGINFNTFLNDMPVKFMIGTVTDSSAATVANTSKFYSSKVVTDPNDSHISGWYGLHQEDSYMWGMSENQVLKRNEEMWSDFVDVGTDITKHGVKGTILKFKFNSMFSLSNAAYIVKNVESFYYEAQGGVSPTLYRNVVPKYSSIQAMRSRYVLSDDNMATGQKFYPNIVGNNYSWIDGYDVIRPNSEEGPSFNNYHYYNEFLGNYFAAFTNNGGYTSKTEVDSDATVARIPTNAKVTPIADFEKRLGRDIESDIEYFEPAYNTVNGFQPYLRAMYVDRRFDFNITLFGPCMPSSSVNLYPGKPDNDGKIKADPREKIWKSARISGVTYNGIEMSYDRDYNVISANTNEDGSVATPNNRLEYSYNFSDVDEDAKTIYNMEKNMIWEEDAYGVQETEEDKRDGSSTKGKMIPKYYWVCDECNEKFGLKLTEESSNTKKCPKCNSTKIHKTSEPIYAVEPKEGQIIKRFYEATFVGVDIRNLFWSDFNKFRLNQFVNSDTYNVDNEAPYVFKYPNTTTSLYNGDFNRFNVISAKNYPTKRFIDVCNIMPSGSYDLDISNCSYNMTAHYESDGSITAETRGVDAVTLTTSFNRPVRFISPNSESDDYANVRYNITTRTKDGYKEFAANSISLSFSINPAYNDDFEVFTAVPKLIKVLPYKKVNGKEYDGISYIKTVTPNGEVAAMGGVLNAMDEVTIYVFERLSNGGLSALFGFDTMVPNGVWYEEMQLRDGSWTESWFYKNDDMFLSDDTSDFQSIKYFLNDFDDIKNCKMFAICVERQYVSLNRENLTKSVRTFEFSDIYDARPLYIQVKTDEDANDPQWTYVEKRTIRQKSAQGEESESEIAVFVQVITFELYFPQATNPESGCCEAFGDTKTMSYTLSMKNQKEDVYQLPAIETSVDEDKTKIRLKFRWSQDMGSLGDKEIWGDGTECSLAAKTGSNFIYRLNWFKLINVVKETCNIDDMKEGARCVNSAKI